MPEEELATADRRATWTAVRTFRQRPSIVGRTDKGETVFEIRSVRMLLPAGASHFKRLVQCAKCGGEMAGMPILTLDDLDRHPNPVFCGGCVRAAPRAFEGPQESERTEENGSSVAAVHAPLVEMSRPLDSPPAFDPAVAALAAEVAELRREVQTIARSDARPGMAAMMEAHRRALHASLDEGQRALRNEMSALEQQSRDQAAAFTQLVQAQRGEMEESLEDVVRRTLAAVGPLVKEVTDRQQALEEKLSKAFAEARAETLVLLAERAEVASVDDLAAAVERRLSEAQAAMAALLDAERELVADGLDRLRADVASLAQAVERGPERAAQHALDAVSDPLRDLTRARAATERALEILAASVGTGATRQQALERKLNEYADRIASLLEPPCPVEPDSSNANPGGRILQALERQLQAAEERLARR